jgi:hypothetical protein
MKLFKRVLLWTGVWLQSAFVLPAFAGGGMITTYTHHLEAGEFEVMLMNDFTLPSQTKRDEEGQGNYFSQMLELEYVPTSQLGLEAMVEAFQDVGTGDSKFTGYRLEARYRLFKREIPLNPMVYVEYEDLDPETRYKMEVSGWIQPPYEEDEEEPSRERIIESRAILSQDFASWTAALNWINESDLHSGETAFGYSMGVLYRLLGSHHEHHHGGTEMAEEEYRSSRFSLFRPAALGLELLGGLGDTQALDMNPSRQEHYLQPSVMYHFGKEMMAHLGAAIGLSEASDNLIRFSWGWEF